MSTGLTLSLPVSAVTTLAAYAKDSKFLPRIQLISSGKYVLNGKIGPGHFGIPREELEIDDLGKSIDVIPLVVRDKAMDTGGETPVVCYDKNDPLFQDIKERSAGENSQCMYGPSLLVYERSTKKLYEFFCGTSSHRKSSEQVTPYMPVDNVLKSCTFTSRLKTSTGKKGTFSWFVFDVFPCSNSIEMELDVADVNAEAAKFANPPKEGTEVASGDARGN